MTPNDVQHLHHIWTRLYPLADELWEIAQALRRHCPDIDALQKRKAGYDASISQSDCKLFCHDVTPNTADERK